MDYYYRDSEVVMRAVGIDISKWQSTYKPNDEAKFVIMRSGYGLMPDKCFEDFYDAAYLVRARAKIVIRSDWHVN